MESIENVKIGAFSIRPNILGTTGVSSCITALIELESAVFVYHLDPVQFNADASCSLMDAKNFVKEIFDALYQTHPQAVPKHAYLLGGYYHIDYMQLRNQIDVMRENSKSALEVNVTSLFYNFDHFVSSIKLNLIGFNTQSKTFEVVYDRSSSPATLAVWQYGGREYEMVSDRTDDLLLAIYQVDTITHVVHAYMCPGARKSLYYEEFSAQVSRNVSDSMCLHQSLTDPILQKKLDGLLARVEQNPMFNDDDC